ncbi:hypothetical protein H8S23_11770 [Anaerofilum sp. BX8]|uniref:Sporulation integral membrane protein YlbJ n=1 Tax=Anaerofilum hominis TaxID=2763016 RepID=A0A923L1F3_9FIRM|nr:hypothetical protein [Anaerofilum hominis]MBC5582185.1 hypothetical protein [Anaerofilum hominis]
MNPTVQKASWRSPVCAAALLGCAVLILLRPDAAAAGVKEGLTRCYNSLIPALFPFLVLTRLILDSGAARLLGAPFAPYCRLLGIRSREAGAALAMGLLGGFAAAGCSIDALYRRGEITARQAEVLLCAAAGEGPAFVISAVGYAMLGSLRQGTALLCSLMLASLISAPLAARLLTGRTGALPPSTAAPAEAARQPDAAGLLVSAVSAAVETMLRICGFVLLFGLLCSLLIPQGAPGWAAALAGALLEVSAGCRAASLLEGLPSLLFCALSLSALGLSAFAQLRALLSPEIRVLPLACSRLLHFPLTCLLLQLFLRFLPGEETTAAAAAAVERLILPFRLPREASFFLFLLLAVFCSELVTRTPLRRKKKDV